MQDYTHMSLPESRINITRDERCTGFEFISDQEYALNLSRTRWSLIRTATIDFFLAESSLEVLPGVVAKNLALFSNAHHFFGELDCERLDTDNRRRKTSLLM